jgi:hypothetical protein
MSDIINQYSETLVSAFENNNFDPVLELFADSFEASVKAMGQTYQFTEKERLKKFFEKTPRGFSISIKNISETGEKNYEVSIAMGMGMLKMPGKLTLKLDDKDKINYFSIK